MKEQIGNIIGRILEMTSFASANAVYRAAMQQACAAMSDTDARAGLCAKVGGNRHAARSALKTLTKNRSDFQCDRAYRLLEAVVNDTAVTSIAPESAELFMREEQLGRVSLKDAYGQLKQLEPSLEELEIEVTRHSGGTSASKDASVLAVEKAIRRRLSMLLGASAQHSDSLMRSQIAQSIATQYLAIVAGNDKLGDQNTSYFDAPRRVVLRSGSSQL